MSKQLSKNISSDFVFVSSMSLGQSVNRLSKYARKDDVDYDTMLVFIMFTSNFVSSLEEKYHHG